MPVNKNALIRYKTLDDCLRNNGRKWTLNDLVEACSNALAEYEGNYDGVSVRTIQGDLQMMRSDKLGYNAPIEVYQRKYYRYSDPKFSIMRLPLSKSDVDTMSEAIDLLRQFEDFDHFREMSDVVSRLQDNLAIAKGRRRLVDFERNSSLRGLSYINPLYNYIEQRRVLRVFYQSFNTRKPCPYVVSPHLLKEYRNRWFLFCTNHYNGKLYNLALDRIKGFEFAEDERYMDNPEFDPNTYFSDIIGVTRSGKAVTIKFWANKEQAAYILTKPIHPSQRVVSVGDNAGGSIFEIRVEPNYEFYAVMLGFGAGVRILSPNSVVREIKRTLHLAAEQYEKGWEM